ncbi:unnamed protein product [Cyclocybe aegerita]|uniref:CBM1 domain-containing protein n=1 Tax=Cyclocybe aegerita TaxID=1973307 RepID=A0A8S0VQK7_CYCAE|nr:unnamed protein product [Cyclocybe aegerita]
MFSLSAIPVSALLALLPYVSAQAPVWGQCGGQGWTGPTTCASGSVCTFSNQWYSQCLPGSAPTTAVVTQPATTTTSGSAPTTTAASKANYWFSFGDSYTQTGFTPSGALPNSVNPFGNPDFPGWTATGGTNWVGYVTTTYNNSLLYTYNYAYGGATIDANLVKPYTPTVLSLTDQVSQFLTTVANKPASTPWTSSNALFSIWIGINDIGNSWYLSGDRGAFSDTLLNAEFALVQKLYDVGARNFLFVNVPPIERSPLMLRESTESQAGERAVITGFNSRLVAKANAFAAANSGVKTFFWDSHAQFTTILNSPQTYGFKDATSYGSGSDIFWGNDYHPSSFAHKFFGQEVGENALKGTIW